MSHGSAKDEVHIYLRNSQKRAHYIKIRKDVSEHEIRRIVSEKLRLAPEKLVLFLKGEQIVQDSTVTLHDKNIVHVVNLDNVNKPSLNLHIKRLEGERTLTHFEVQSGSLIKDFIDGPLLNTFQQSSEDVFLVYTGKQLDIHKSFAEEYVEDESELLCVNLEQSEYQIQESNITKIEHKKLEKREDGKNDIELGPGRSSMEGFTKKSSPGVSNAAPSSQQELEIAPPNIVKKENIPKEINPEDLKNFQEVAPQQEEQINSKLHSSLPRDEESEVNTAIPVQTEVRENTAV